MYKMFILYTIAYLAFAFPYGYMQIYLSHIGYSVFERGLILSGAAIVSIIGQLSIGYLCDKYKSDKRFYRYIMIILVVCTYFMYVVTKQIFFFHLIFVSFVGGFVRILMSVQDAWCLESDETCLRNFGTIRAFGSIGWMIGSPLAAVAIHDLGYGSIPHIFLVLTLFNFLLTSIMQDAQKHEKSASITFNDVILLLRNRQFASIVFMFFVINMIATADAYTVIDKMIELGASEANIAARWSIQALVELPLFFAGGYLLRKHGNFKLVSFGIFMYSIRFIAYGLAQSTNQILLASLMQLVTFPLIMITSKTLIDQVTPPHMRASGQTIAGAMYAGMSALITPIVAGTLVTKMGIDVTFFIFAILGIIPLSIAIQNNKGTNERC